MNGYTRCRFCLKTVRVTDGKLGRHVSGFWEKTCKGFKTNALWAEEHALSAMGRNTEGVCMKCGETETNPDCHQCCYEKRHEQTTP